MSKTDSEKETLANALADAQSQTLAVRAGQSRTDENDGWGLPTRLREKIAHSAWAHADKHLHEV